MAQSRQDLLSKLADRGEDVVGKLADMPAAQRLVDAGVQLKDRVDELQKRVRGLDALEQRLERSVERRPSLMSRLGLSTIQVLSTPSEEQGDDTLPSTPLVVAFTDLEGFTRFTSTEGDEAASQLLATATLYTSSRSAKKPHTNFDTPALSA